MQSRPHLMSASRLPVETSDMIIDFVANGREPKRTLLSCSLVCKDWRPRCLHHLLRCLEVTGPEYVSLFRYPPTATSGIRYLTVSNGDDGAASPWPGFILYLASRRCTRVQDLQIDDVAFELFPRRTLRPSYGGFTHLKSLHISESSFATVADCTSVLLQMVRLEDAELGVYFGSFGVESLAAVCPPAFRKTCFFQFGDIYTAGKDGDLLTHWLAQKPECVSGIESHLVCNTTCGAVGYLIAHHARPLMSTLTISFKEDIALWIQDVNLVNDLKDTLRGMTGLDDLNILVGVCKPVTECLPVVAELVEATCDKLRVFRLEIRDIDSEGSNPLIISDAWAPLAAALSTNHRSPLDRVEIQMEENETVPWRYLMTEHFLVLPTATKFFPDFMSRRVLKGPVSDSEDED